MKSKDGDGDRVEFALVLFAVPPGTEISRILEARQSAVAKLPGYRLIRAGEEKIAGRRAPSLTVSYTGAHAKTIVNHSMILVEGTSTYLFAWITGQEKFALGDPTLQKILASFELVKP